MASADTQSDNNYFEASYKHDTNKSLLKPGTTTKDIIDTTNNYPGINTTNDAADPPTLSVTRR